MKNKQGSKKVQSLLTLLLFGIFAVCILSVLLTGADIYQRLAQRDRRSYDHRTVSQYLSTRVRQADRLGGVQVRTFEGCPALILEEEIDGVAYVTRIYHYDGYIRELFAAAEGDFLPEHGEKILPAGGLLVEWEEPGLVLRILTESGQWQVLQLHLRSGEEGLS